MASIQASYHRRALVLAAVAPVGSHGLGIETLAADRSDDPEIEEKAKQKADVNLQYPFWSERYGLRSILI